MKKKQFTEEVVNRLREITGCKIEVSQAKKNNGIKVTSLIIKRDVERNMYPVIYIEPFYEIYKQGEDFNTIIERMLEFESEYEIQNDFDVSFFENFEKVRADIYYRLVNYTTNQTMLVNMPHRKYLDLVKIYYVAINVESYGEGTILIKNDYLEKWGIDDNELDRIATLNTETKIIPVIANVNEIVKNNLRFMFEELKKDGEIPEDAEMPDLNNIGRFPMHVVTNEERYYGASVLMYKSFLNVVSKVMKSDLVIFPSSVHEFIFMSADLVDEYGYDRLKEIVKDINQKVVIPEEFLSNNVYYYDRQNAKLTIYKDLEG